MTSIWDKYPDYTADELRNLVAVAAQVLQESDEAADAVPPDLLELPIGATARQLAPLLDGAEAGAIRTFLEDEELARKASLHVLGQIRQHPDLADRVAEAYEARSHKMAIETVLLAGALVILAIKLKKVSFKKEGFEAIFTESQEAVKTFVTGLTKLAGG